jgi:ribosomal protein S18 acetylase RimI-like enzyme/predicted nucleic acid-binding protein
LKSKLSLKDVLPFVETVQAWADENKNALGFLPAQVYLDAAREGKLWVAVSGDKATYCGHILIGGRFPHIRIYQVSVVARFRNRGIGRSLIDAVISMAENKGFRSVSAKVADDLEANSFWEKIGFSTVRRQRGGESKNRILHVRIRELNTRTLFGFPEGELVSRLSIAGPESKGPAVYAVDLNVFFDVIRKRPRADDAGRVFSAALKGIVTIVVTQEFVNELRRNSKAHPDDPVLELAQQLPTVPMPPAEISAKLVDELARLVFPSRASSLNTHDRSDLIHIATAIHDGLAGFITAEAALIRSALKVREKFGIAVVDVARFAELLRHAEGRLHSTQARLGENSLQVCEVTPQYYDAVQILINKAGFTDEASRIASRPGSALATERSLVVLVERDVIAIISWGAGDSVRRVFSARLFADEDSPFLETALDALLFRFAKEAVQSGPAILIIRVPRGSVRTSEIARQHGFSVNHDSAIGDGMAELQRIAVGAPVVPGNWQGLRELIQRHTGLIFEPLLPCFKLHSARFSFASSDGRKLVSLEDLETALSPVLFLLESRIATIVPIRPEFAAQLLGTSQQTSLLPTQGAQLFHERVYYSRSGNARLLPHGSPVVFYESGKGRQGRSAAIALARVLRTELEVKKEVCLHDFEHGVLDANGLESISSRDKLAVTTFDNVIPLKFPVSLRRLRGMGCVGGANLISATRLDAEQFAAIVQEGFYGGV